VARTPITSKLPRTCRQSLARQKYAIAYSERM
jgi:hypothetical protein